MYEQRVNQHRKHSDVVHAAMKGNVVPATMRGKVTWRLQLRGTATWCMQ